MDERPQGVVAPSKEGFDYNDSDYQRQRNNGSMDWDANTDPEGIKSENSANGRIQNAVDEFVNFNKKM